MTVTPEPADDSGFRAHLLRQAEEALAGQPDLPYSWARDSAAVTLTFPEQVPGGFAVVVTATERDVTVHAGGAHVSFGDEDNPAAQVAAALGLARDLLSPRMRLRECRAGRRAYRWYLEVFDGDTWRVEHETGLVLWNYFGGRTERTYQNRTLPSRQALGGAGATS